MKNFDILDALNEIDDECIINAKKSIKTRDILLKLAAGAACICLTMTFTFFAVYQIQKITEPDMPSVTDNGTQKNDSTEETADL